VTLHALVAAILAERATLSAGEASGGLAIACGALAALAVLALVAHRAGREMPAFVAPALSAAAAGALASLVLLACEASAAEALGAVPVSSWGFRALADATQNDYGWRCKAEASCAGQPSAVVWLELPEEVSAGQVVHGVGRFAAGDDGEWAARMRMQGVVGTARIVRVGDAPWASGPLGALARVRAEVVGRISPASSEERGLMAGIVCGSKVGLAGSPLEDDFASCGAAHLIAVSGSHLSLISALLGSALLATGLSHRARDVLLALVTGAFVAFSGAPASAVRSWAMSLAATGSWALGRRSHALSSACTVSCLMCLAMPSCAGDVGFLLSVASVVGISAFAPYASYALDAAFRVRRLRGVPKRLRRRVASLGRSARSAVAVTLVAQLATMPITVPLFGRLSLVAPLANLVLGPLFTLSLASGLVASLASLVPVLGAPAVSAGALASLPTCMAAHALARVPLASVAVSWGEASLWAAVVGLAVALLATWPSLSRRRVLVPAGVLAAACIALLVRWRFFSPRRASACSTWGKATPSSCRTARARFWWMPGRTTPSSRRSRRSTSCISTLSSSPTCTTTTTAASRISRASWAWTRWSWAPGWPTTSPQSSAMPS
jgi:competence protein ComEC